MDIGYRPASWNYDTIICKGDEVTLTVNPNDSKYRYEWREYDSEISDFKIMAAGPTFTLRPENNGSYSVDAFGKKCETSYGYDVILDEPMKIETEIIDKRSIALQVSGGYGSYQYDLGEGYGTSDVIEDFDYMNIFSTGGNERTHYSNHKNNLDYYWNAEILFGASLVQLNLIYNLYLLFS